MNPASRISSLNARHFSLEDQLHQEMSQLVPDEDKVKQMKRKKLEIKDEISSLQKMSLETS